MQFSFCQNKPLWWSTGQLLRRNVDADWDTAECAAFLRCDNSRNSTSCTGNCDGTSALSWNPELKKVKKMHLIKVKQKNYLFNNTFIGQKLDKDKSKFELKPLTEWHLMRMGLALLMSMRGLFSMRLRSRFADRQTALLEPSRLWTSVAGRGSESFQWQFLQYNWPV